jgi:hypothetical protein
MALRQYRRRLRSVARALLLASLVLGALAASQPAGATNATNCAGLQAALDAAHTGDTIVLDEMCTGQTFDLSGSNQSYILTGQAGSGAGFDGTGSASRMLSANGAVSPTTLTLTNLIFRNGTQGSGNGGALAFQGDYSVTLAGDTFTDNNVDAGLGGALSIATTGAPATIELTDDTFAGNQALGGVGLGGAVSIAILGSGGTVTLDGDTFTSNQASLAGGAVEFSTEATSGSLTVSNSSFQGNSGLDTGGALDVCDCGAPLPVNLTGNTFSGNSLAGAGCGCTLDGGAAFLDNEAGGNAALTQSDNTFSGNSVTGGTSDVAGGAEAVVGMTLTSTHDLFTGNSLQAPVAGQVSDGAALSVQNDCSASIPQHTVTDTAIAGNSIGDGANLSGAHGALAFQCEAGFSSNPKSLLLRDVTITANTGGGGTSAIYGDHQDQLLLQNSIVDGDSDGSEVSGFESFGGGSLAATFSDYCAGSVPFSGTGNICADPALVDASSGNVRETSASPTIDAGSNGLVPGGIATDVYGGTRIQSRLIGGTALVDMGAAEIDSVATVPDEATGVSATRGDREATVSWSVPGFDGGAAITAYTVTSSPGGKTCSWSGGALSCTVTGLSNGTSYSFRVTATNSAGTGSPSSASSPVIPAGLPGAPSGVSASAGDRKATVQFAAPGGNGSAISSYTVHSSHGQTATGTHSPIVVTGLANGTSYTFRVTATNGVGTGSLSSPSSAVTPAGVPGAPTGVSASAGDRKATVSFVAPPGNGSAITSYAVHSSHGQTATGTHSPIVVTGLANGTSYTFRVTATNGVGTGSLSSPSSAVTPAGVPGAPTGVSASAGDRKATVSFVAPPGNGSAISLYTVHSSHGQTATGTHSPIVVTGLANGTSYTFRVTATNGAGTGSLSSSSSAVTPAGLPGAPTSVSASAGDRKATVSFVAPPGNGSAITLYTVHSSHGQTATGTHSPIVVTGLTNFVSYTFRVTATNGVGTGALSAPSNVVTPIGLVAVRHRAATRRR